MEHLYGLYAALATPYQHNGDVDSEALTRLVNFIAAQGINGLYVGGSTGEALLQSLEERKAILQHVASHRPAGNRLIGHVGALSTRESIALAQCCVTAGYDAISAIPPIYYPYNRQDIFTYYRQISEAAEGVPLVIYNIPAMSGVSFTLDDLQQLLQLPNIRGIKQTSMNMYQMEQISRLFPQALLLNGYDEVFLAGVVSGAKGGVGSTYNIMGRRFVRLKQALERGDLQQAKAIQSQCNEVIDLLVKAGVFPAIKYILQQMAIVDCADCRAPLSPVESQWHQPLQAVARQLLQEAESLG